MWSTRVDWLAADQRRDRLYALALVPSHSHVAYIASSVGAVSQLRQTTTTARPLHPLFHSQTYHLSPALPTSSFSSLSQSSSLALYPAMSSVMSLVYVTVALLLVSFVSVAADPSFCDKYSMALFNSTDGDTETKLITAVVTRAVLGDTTVDPPVPGLVAANSPILQVST